MTLPARIVALGSHGWAARAAGRGQRAGPRSNVSSLLAAEQGGRETRREDSNPAQSRVVGASSLSQVVKG